MANPTACVKPSWLPLINRLQKAASRGRCAIVAVTFVVDQQGDPQYWAEPEVTLIESPAQRREDILATFMQRGSGR